MNRHDGLRAQGYEPRASGPVGRPLTIVEDRLLLLALIACCLRKIGEEQSKVLLLWETPDAKPLQVAGTLKCSESTFWRRLRESRGQFETRLRRVGIVR
jgi:hypothetical protein